MKKLTPAEILSFARYLCFSEQDAAEIVEIFYNERAKGNYRMRYSLLESLDDYVDLWESDWYRYSTWEELVESENEQNEGLTEEECISLIGYAIFKLSSGMYIQSVL